MSTQLIGWAQIKQHKDKRFKSRNHSINLLIQFTKHIYTGESVFLFILGLPDPGHYGTETKHLDDPD